MTDHKYQGQHRVSQVYLREFGYQKEGKWYISVWDKSKNYTDYVLIENFTKETNVFDLPFFDSIKERRHFENKSLIIEGEYKKVVNSIKSQQQLTPRHQDVLCHYISNLICRCKPYRELFQNYLDHSVGREAFLKEITVFVPSELPILKTSLSNIPIETHLNYITGHIINHLVKVLRNFSFTILKDYQNRGWFTCDNPVIIDPQETLAEIEGEDYLWTIPVESEIYFPISPDYCVFAYFSNSKKNSNPLRKLRLNRVNVIDEISHDKICRMIASHTSNYFIFNQEIEPFYLDR